MENRAITPHWAACTANTSLVVMYTIFSKLPSTETVFNSEGWQLLRMKDPRASKSHSCNSNSDKRCEFCSQSLAVKRDYGWFAGRSRAKRWRQTKRTVVSSAQQVCRWASLGDTGRLRRLWQWWNLTVRLKRMRKLSFLSSSSTLLFFSHQTELKRRWEKEVTSDYWNSTSPSGPNKWYRGRFVFGYGLFQWFQKKNYLLIWRKNRCLGLLKCTKKSSWIWQKIGWFGAVYQ